MVKTAQDDGPRPTFGDHSDLLAEKEPGHHQFARKYFDRFGQGSGEATPVDGQAAKADIDAVAERVGQVQV